MAEKEGGNGGTSRPGNNRQLSRESGEDRGSKEKSGSLVKCEFGGIKAIRSGIIVT